MSLLLNRAIPRLQREAIPTAPTPQYPVQHTQAFRSYSSKPNRTDKDQEPPQMPKLSLDGLGATPAMKAFIYTAIGIMGTVETYTYSLWIYNKLYPEARVRNGSQQGEEGEGI